MSIHPLPQSACPSAQAGAGDTHTPPWQVWSPAQPNMHPPQLKASVSRSRQIPSPQSVSPAAHKSAGAFVVDAVHAPCWQISPAAQEMPQAPQLSRSVCRSAQVGPQLVSPVTPPPPPPAGTQSELLQTS